MVEQRLQKPLLDEIAGNEKDIDIFSGWLNRLENPDPTLQTEAAGKGLKLYDEVDRDPHAGAVLQTRYLSVIGKEWDVIPGEELRGAGRPKAVSQNEKIAEFVAETLKRMNFDQARVELLQGILYGFYGAEVMWGTVDNAVVPIKIRSKHPRRFSFTMDREPRLLTPQNMLDGDPLPDRKFIIFSYGSSDNPYGKGLGQKLWWPVWFKKSGIKFWLVFLEKYGMPTAIGKYPPGTPPEQQAALLDAIDAIQNETGIKIPETMAIELLEASRSGNVTYEALCEYMDKQISKAVLGQTATTEGTPGKLGNEDSQNDTKQDIIEADAGLLDECLNQTLIRWIVDFNFPNVVNYPVFFTRTDAEEDLHARAERDKILSVDIGLPMSRRYFYETYDIPEPEEGEEEVGGQRPEVGGRMPEVGGQRSEVGGQMSEVGGRTSDIGHRTSEFGEAENDVVDDIAVKMERRDPMETLLEPVLDMVQGAQSFEEISEKLYALYPRLDSKRFQELLGRAMSAVGLSGYGEAR